MWLASAGVGPPGVRRDVTQGAGCYHAAASAPDGPKNGHNRLPLW